jgi:hypothetical protein
MSAAKRTDAGAAAAGLFSRPSATGGLASHRPPAAAGQLVRPAYHAAAHGDAGAAARVRLSVELTEEQIAWLRAQSRPAKTGAPRFLGAKFIATGLLATAIELARTPGIDMYGVDAGDLDELSARCRDALVRAVRHHINDAEPSTDNPDTESTG